MELTSSTGSWQSAERTVVTIETYWDAATLDEAQRWVATNIRVLRARAKEYVKEHGAKA